MSGRLYKLTLPSAAATAMRLPAGVSASALALSCSSSGFSPSGTWKFCAEPRGGGLPWRAASSAARSSTALFFCCSLHMRKRRSPLSALAVKSRKWPLAAGWPSAGAGMAIMAVT